MMALQPNVQQGSPKYTITTFLGEYLPLCIAWSHHLSSEIPGFLHVILLSKDSITHFSEWISAKYFGTTIFLEYLLALTFELRLYVVIYTNIRTKSLREKCPYSELFWSKFSFIRTEYGEIFNPNTGKYGPGKTRYLDTFHAVLALSFYILYFK